MEGPSEHWIRCNLRKIRSILLFVCSFIGGTNNVNEIMLFRHKGLLTVSGNACLCHVSTKEGKSHRKKQTLPVRITRESVNRKRRTWAVFKDLYLERRWGLPPGKKWSELGYWVWLWSWFWAGLLFQQNWKETHNRLQSLQSEPVEIVHLKSRMNFLRKRTEIWVGNCV